MVGTMNNDGFPSLRKILKGIGFKTKWTQRRETAMTHCHLGVVTYEKNAISKYALYTMVVILFLPLAGYGFAGIRQNDAHRNKSDWILYRRCRQDVAQHVFFQRHKYPGLLEQRVCLYSHRATVIAAIGEYL